MNLFLDAVIHIFSSGVGQNDCPVIGFPGTQGAQPFDLCLSVFEQCGGDFESKNLPALLEKAVILPHDELTGPVRTGEVLLAHINRLAAAWAEAHRFLLRLEQLLPILGNVGVFPHQLRAIASIPSMKSSGDTWPFATSFNRCSQSAVSLGEVCSSGSTVTRLTPAFVGIRFLPLRSTNPPDTSFSIMAALVAGGPRPLRSASSGISSLPAFSMADRRVSSV